MWKEGALCADIAVYWLRMQRFSDGVKLILGHSNSDRLGIEGLSRQSCCPPTHLS